MGYGKTNFYTRLSKIIEKINLSNDKEDFIIFYIIGAVIGVFMELLIKLFTGKEDIPIVLYCVNGTGTVFTIYGISCVFRVLL